MLKVFRLSPKQPYLKTNRSVQDKSRSKKTLSTIHMQEGRSIDTVFEVEGGISNYSLSKDGKSMYEKVKLEQDYRKFDFDSPWEGTKYIDEIKNKGKQDG